MTYLESGEITANSESADIRLIAADVYAAYSNRVNADKVAFTYGVAENIPDKIMLDVVRITQCMKTLVSNAAKYTRNGCIHMHITIRPILAAPGDDEHVSQLSIIVIDTGIGITDEIKSTLFEPLPMDSKNEGLSLSMARNYARLMGGNLTVKTNLGLGSEFTLLVKTLDVELASLDLLKEGPSFTFVPEFPHGIPSIPKINKKEIERRKHELAAYKIIANNLQDILPEIHSPYISKNEPSKINLRGGFSRHTPRSDTHLTTPEHMDGLNILVAEDVIANQEIIRSLLEPAGCNICVANHGKQALELMENQIFDVILMDIHMPIMNGIETTEHIRSHNGPHQDVPIIALTADASAENNAECLAVGADVFLTKPIILSELFASIRYARQKKLRAVQKTLCV